MSSSCSQPPRNQVAVCGQSKTSVSKSDCTSVIMFHSDCQRDFQSVFLFFLIFREHIYQLLSPLVDWTYNPCTCARVGIWNSFLMVHGHCHPGTISDMAQEVSDAGHASWHPAFTFQDSPLVTVWCSKLYHPDWSVQKCNVVKTPSP